MPNWKKIYSSNNPYRIGMIKDILENNDISAFTIDKQESVYQIHGYVEIYVEMDQVVRALKIINDIKFE